MVVIIVEQLHSSNLVLFYFLALLGDLVKFKVLKIILFKYLWVVYNYCS